PRVLNVRARAPAIRDGAGVLGGGRVEKADAYAAEVGERARVQGEPEEAVPIAGQPAVGVDAGHLDAAGEDVPALAERVGDAVDVPDVRLLEYQREAACPDGNAGVLQRDPGHERRLVVAPRQHVQGRLVDEPRAGRVRVAKLYAVDPILGLDPGVVRYLVAEVRLTVVVATGPHRVERVGAAERRREPHHAGVVLRGRLEGPAVGVRDVGPVRRPQVHD